MKTRLTLLVLALVVIISPRIILADYNDSVVYLEGQNQNAWITQALAAAGVASPEIDYLDTQTTDLMTASKNLLALSAIGSQDADSLNSLVSTIENSVGSGQIGSLELLNDDFWALMALSAVGESSQAAEAKNFILSHQNEDGGWSWSATGDSDTNDTAAAIMALLDVGLSSSSVEIANAFYYLQTTQNEDGGFGYDSASESDGASTAWIMAALNKANIDPNTWQVGSNSPNSFLESLHQEDGSFLWLPSDSNGSAMVTSYALVALSGESYPVNYITIPQEEVPIVGHDIRIEGPEETICLASGLEADTVLDLLELASSVCDFEYIAENTEYGVYVSSIDGVAAEGMDGWQFFVDFLPASGSAAEHQLTNDEEVLWGYGAWPLYPTKIETNDIRLAVSDDLVIDAKYHNGTNWQPWTDATVYVGDDIYQTDSSGQVIVAMPYDGVFSVWAGYGPERIRSNKIYVTVGNGVSQTVDLTVNIEADGSGNPGGGGDVIAFSVDQSSVNFGSLKPGQSSDTILNLSNDGNVDIYIEASIIGESLFEANTSLNQSNWQDYNLNLPSISSESVNIGLSVPQDFDQTGQKNGQLIFWAINQ